MKKNFLIILALVILTLTVWWFKAIKPNLWNGKRQFNLSLFSEDTLVLVSNDPINRTVFVVFFPGDLLVNTFGNYGQLRLSKLSELAFQEEEELIVPKTIEYCFGFPLDFWSYLEKSQLSYPQEELEDGLGIVKKAIKDLLFSRKRLSFSQRVNLWKINRWLASHRPVIQIKKGDKDFFEKKDDFYRFNQEAWDDWASIYLADPWFKNEQLAIGIYNAAGISGLANELARILSNSGMLVVAVKDREQKEQTCLLRIKSEQVKKSWTYQRLVNLIKNCEIKISGEEEFGDSTQINIYLGETFNKLR
ncbi:LytR C-terminal domain-containing protein [Candidatus Shapirobacteria bacterium]|nr:LytR C-terminal domain-containing protein [Candidatus Shapirobacteria bacterium]